VQESRLANGPGYKRKVKSSAGLADRADSWRPFSFPAIAALCSGYEDLRQIGERLPATENLALCVAALAATNYSFKALK
jgi:hypothetical protein